MAFASAEIISIFNKIKYPYNVNQLTQQQALSMLQRYDEIKGWVKELIAERGRLMDAFSTLTCVKEIFPSDANFFLAKGLRSMDRWPSKVIIGFQSGRRSWSKSSAVQASRKERRSYTHPHKYQRR